MTFVSQTDGRRLRCRRQLSRMWALALEQDDTAPSWLTVGEIREAAGAVVAEMEATNCAIVEDGQRSPGAELILWARVARLAKTADRVADAAQQGDAAELRAHLRHFETLASALWTVQEAL